MSRVLRSVRKRKKGCTLGAVDVIDREGYAELEVEAKVEWIRSLVPLGLLHIEELLDEEVTALAGERYARKDPSVGGRRHGSNPGTVGLAGRRGDSRGDRAVGVDRVPGVHRGQRGQAPRALRAGPVPGGRRRPGAGRQDLRRVDDGRRAGHHDDGGETLPERGLDVSQGLLVIVDGGKGSGRPCGRPSATAPWCNGVMAQARESG